MWIVHAGFATYSNTLSHYLTSIIIYTPSINLAFGRNNIKKTVSSRLCIDKGSCTEDEKQALRAKTLIIDAKERGSGDGSELVGLGLPNMIQSFRAEAMP